MASVSPPAPARLLLSDQSKFRNVTIKFAKAKKGGDAAAASRRVACSCQAREHELLTNCTVCGRIVCVLEGEGECAFCSSLVSRGFTTPSEEFVRSMRMRTASSLTASASTTADSQEALIRAEQQKARLLSFAARNEARSRVVDQQSDYYELESNVWMGAEQREQGLQEAKAEEDKIGRRRDHTVSIDLVTGTVIAHSSDPLAAENAGKGLKGSGMEIVTREDEQRRQQEAASTGRPISANAARSGVSSPAVNAMFEEMKSVSRAQYFNNDTLRGRARQVYEQLQAAIEQEHKVGSL